MCADTILLVVVQVKFLVKNSLQDLTDQKMNRKDCGSRKTPTTMDSSPGVLKLKPANLRIFDDWMYVCVTLCFVLCAGMNSVDPRVPAPLNVNCKYLRSV